jgi:hypothetical protein
VPRTDSNDVEITWNITLIGKRYRVINCGNFPGLARSWLTASTPGRYPYRNLPDVLFDFKLNYLALALFLAMRYMKPIIFSVFLLTTGVAAWGQNFPPDYHLEIGFNVGKSVATLPGHISAPYAGTEIHWKPDYSVRINYSWDPHWQICADFGTRRWISYGNWNLQDNYGKSLGYKKITFLIADPAMNFAAEFNRLIPFYSAFHKYNKSNLYFGVMAGLMATVNDGSIHYDLNDKAPNPNYQYASQYNYGPGIGINLGVQVGYTYYFIPRFGVNVELAGRYAYIGTDDTKYDHVNSRYHLLYFPETVGLRYRF